MGEHILVAERALGKFLPLAAHVHHVNYNPSDNRPCNLVICQDEAYHHLLHWRTRILREGGKIGVSRFCPRCKTIKPWDQYKHNYRACRDCRLARNRLKWRERTPVTRFTGRGYHVWEVRRQRAAAKLAASAPPGQNHNRFDFHNHERTLRSLSRHGWVTEDGVLTDAGRAALAKVQP